MLSANTWSGKFQRWVVQWPSAFTPEAIAFQHHKSTLQGIGPLEEMNIKMSAAGISDGGGKLGVDVSQAELWDSF